MEFDWDKANIDHIRMHGVEPDEAVEVFFGEPVVVKEQVINGEARSVIVGRTTSDRTLVVVYTVRKGLIRVVTAFPAKRKLRRLYEEVQNG